MNHEAEELKVEIAITLPTILKKELPLQILRKYLITVYIAIYNMIIFFHLTKYIKTRISFTGAY